MNYKLAIAMFSELQTLLDLLQSPNARWDTVQDWLKRNPRWQDEIDYYVQIEPDEAITNLQIFLIEQAEIPGVLIATAITPQIKAQARSAIEKLQTLYRERANMQTEKEIKNVSTKPARRMGKGTGRQNQRSRKTARKRTAQDRD